MRPLVTEGTNLADKGKGRWVNHLGWSTSTGLPISIGSGSEWA